ncbi:MAG TPA: molybdenum cofactor biosynthesis protein MoaE [Gemmatimonadaceae bacterium]|nr:molybdenum cofactor biosynthesis protein MoaE [Gemmatimonadaceae bacterium]
MRAALVTRPIDVAAMIAEVADPSCGAASVFLGTVRNVNDGRQVTGIEYKAYEPMAVREIGGILSRARDRFGIEHIVVEHRLGFLELGEVSIAIVAAHPHRQAAMDATRYAIEEIKKKVPIWKLEHYADGSREWVDPTRAADDAPQPGPVAEVVG